MKVFFLVLWLWLVCSISSTMSHESKFDDAYERYDSESQCRVLGKGYWLNADMMRTIPPQELKRGSIIYHNCTTPEIHDWIPCEAKCEHAKLIFTLGYCKCVCRKNFAPKDGVNCVPAFWTKWNSWSECLKSDWGGLQTRQRVCKAEQNEAPGSCEGKGSESRSCSDVKKEFRIRKRLSSLSDEELHDIIQAMTKLKNDKTKFGYRELALWHGYPGICPWNRKHKRKDFVNCSWHFHPFFIPWHRLYVAHFEVALSRYLNNKTLGWPYWDYTEPRNDFPELIRNPEIFDPVLKKFVCNPFYSSYIGNISGVHRYTKRHPWWPGWLLYGFHQRNTVKALLVQNPFKSSWSYEKSPHGALHEYACSGIGFWSEEENCLYSIRATNFSAFDPMFFFIHGGVDRVYTMKRKLEDNFGMEDWTYSRIIGAWAMSSISEDPTFPTAFEWMQSPFCNESINPWFSTFSPGTFQMKSLYYGEELFGYRYEDYDLGDYNWSKLKEDFRRNVVSRNIQNDYFLETGIGNLTETNSVTMLEEPLCPQYKSTVITS